ncbi:hypothetical protein [Desulfurivibrio alkaliphilus]|uniref:Transporter n=1 Tax=Desulfurivibrio alkaliphilus (strain DSM 19089 / UNIQEM U267 / AHT2) TaxID=589865 RepID=D6Z1R3_DESAT|nr:hypothetical protein [Desulfurivibrio alkaliphilus]ADH85488.1 hypothetical protein DaAHT2_0784 [Desulfurivibrio alkaliphilus AHT 2]
MPHCPTIFLGLLLLGWLTLAPLPAKAATTTQPASPAATDPAASTEAEERMPVRVEELLTRSGRWQLDGTLQYNNNNRQAEHVTLQGPHLSIGQSRENSLVAELRLRYGVSDQLELAVFGSGFWEQQRDYVGGRQESTSRSGFNMAGLGAVYQWRREDRWPALLLTASLNGVEQTRLGSERGSNYLRTISPGLITYYTLDPVIFFLQTTYQHQRSRRAGDYHYEPGSLLSLTPQLFFIANPDITISGGFKWTLRGGDRLNGRRLNPTTSTTSPLLGISYAISDRLSFFLDCEFNFGANYAGSQISWRLSRTF